MNTPSIGQDDQGHSSRKGQQRIPEVQAQQQPQVEPVEQQSPINFELSALKRRALNEFPLCLPNYKKSLPGTFRNTGTTIKFVPNIPKTEWPQMSSQLFNQDFRFVGYHFHWSQGMDGSEHALGGLKYVAELHMVHEGLRNASEMAVLGVFLTIENASTPDNAKMVFSKEETDALKQLVHCGQTVTIGGDHTLSSKLPDNNSQEVSSSSNMDHPASPFLRYQGSLTTHPYTEGVTWTMFTDPLVITEEQMSLLRLVRDSDGKRIEKNYRTIQSTNGREVLFFTKE